MSEDGLPALTSSTQAQHTVIVEPLNGLQSQHAQENVRHDTPLLAEEGLALVSL